MFSSRFLYIISFKYILEYILYSLCIFFFLGSVTDYLVDDTRWFKYFYMAVSASIQGRTHCRPMVSIDDTFLTGDFRGCLIIACTLDVSQNIFPRAMVLMDLENDELYEWFLRNLRKSIC